MYFLHIIVFAHCHPLTEAHILQKINHKWTDKKNLNIVK